jgi:hypothetical protein
MPLLAGAHGLGAERSPSERTMSKKPGWVITTSGDRPITEISKDLEAVGFEIRHVLTEIRSITGSADKKLVAKLRKVRGVIDVSPETSIDVGPPDAGDVW